MSSSWEKVQLARHPKRPTSKTVIHHIIDDFIELHGDRSVKDDLSIIGGIGYFEGIPVTVIAQEKGTDTNDKIKRNFGMPHPEGYEKALRLMKQAEKFKRPILVFIDTPGAYPGLEAEMRNQAFKIANNLKEMMCLDTPIIAVVLSEGGSGGALAIGVADQLLMFENSIYSILSPEGFASILYKDSKKANEAAEIMKLSANDLLDLRIIDGIIKEKNGLHEDQTFGFKELRSQLSKRLTIEMNKDAQKRLNDRYQKYRLMGVFTERI